MSSFSILCACLSGLALGALLGPLPGLVAASLLMAGAWSADRHLWALALALTLALGALRGAGLREPEASVVAGSSNRSLARFEVGAASWPGASCRIPLRARNHARWRLHVREGPCDFRRGDRIGVSLDGHFAIRRYGMRRELYARRAFLLTKPAPAADSKQGRVRHWLETRRSAAWESTRGDDAAALVAAVALGSRHLLSPERRAAFSDSGLGHLLAISGLHVGLVALALAFVLGRWVAWRGRSQAWTLAPSFVLLGLYVLCTGASASALRAGGMVMLLFVARAVGRPQHGRLTLLWAGCAMLLASPSWILDPGFQMSFVAVWALMGAAGRAESTSTPAQRESSAPAGALAMSWRVTWALAGLSAWHFGRLGAPGVLLNLIAIPVFSICVLPAALLGWALGPGSWAGLWLRGLAHHGAKLLVDLADVGQAMANAVGPPVASGAAHADAPVGSTTLLLWFGLAIFGLLLSPLLAWLGRRASWGERLGRFRVPAWASLGLAAVAILRFFQGQAS